MKRLEKTRTRRLERIVYPAGDDSFRGLFGTPEESCPPLVVLFHEYLGMEPQIRDKAMALVDQGFAVFVPDLYGQKIRPRNHQEAYPHYRYLKAHPRVMAQRAQRGVDQAVACVNSQTHAGIAVLGFSMGGWAALGVAGGHPDIRLGVSVYGYLNGLTRLDRLACDLLIIHGLRDKIVPGSDLRAFRDLAGRYHDRCDLVLYDRVGHGFCNPSLEPDPALGNFYDRAYHEKAWHRIVDAVKKMGQKDGTMDKTTTAYDNNAERYADKFMSFAPYADKIRRFRDRYVKANSTLLDLGCGPGNNAAILSGVEGVRIIGMDLSREMVRLARANVPAGEFCVKDLKEFDFQEPCDVVVASFCIVHLTLEETAILIQKISRILKPSGYLYLSFMEGHGQGFETTSFSADEIFFNYYDRDRIAGLLAQNHLAVVETLEGDYGEPDGSITTDIFMVAQGGRGC